MLRKLIVLTSIAGLLGIVSAAFACGNGGGCCGHCGTKANKTKATNTKASAVKATTAKASGKTTNAKAPAPQG